MSQDYYNHRQRLSLTSVAEPITCVISDSRMVYKYIAVFLELVEVKIATESDTGFRLVRKKNKKKTGTGMGRNEMFKPTFHIGYLAPPVYVTLALGLYKSLTRSLTYLLT